MHQEGLGPNVPPQTIQPGKEINDIPAIELRLAELKRKLDSFSEDVKTYGSKMAMKKMGTMHPLFKEYQELLDKLAALKKNPQENAGS